jgi:hypothetical protein
MVAVNNPAAQKRSRRIEESLLENDISFVVNRLVAGLNLQHPAIAAIATRFN